MKNEAPHRVLPHQAVTALQLAAATENTPADPLRRQKAIEKTTQRIKQQYPQFFKIKE
ncbi:hypothetical protein [Oryzomicrobium sp.]|uniref:hypothetical protein n=1 Tax=Oryzomicrobium sp. TaxID=1911578 RepID=UPI002FE35CE1